jgi:hypothetical protein
MDWLFAVNGSGPSGQGLKAGRGVFITGLLNKIVAPSRRLSPTAVTLMNRRLDDVDRQVKRTGLPGITAAA